MFVTVTHHDVPPHVRPKKTRQKHPDSGGEVGGTDPRNTQPHPARQVDNDDRREALYVTSEKSGGGTKKKKKKKFVDGKHG